MKISMLSQAESLPFKRSIEKLEIKSESSIQFCNFDWVAIQKDSDLTLYREGLTAVNEIDLTQLFNRAQCGKVQVYFFEFNGGSNDDKHMLLIGNNLIVLYDILSQKTTCKMQLNDEYRIKKKLQFTKVEILEQNEILYILTDHFDLITLDLSDRDSEFQHQALMKKGNYLSSWFPQNYTDFYQKDSDFRFLVLDQQILIVQQASEDQMRIWLCNQNPYHILASSHQNLALESSLRMQISINSFYLSKDNGIIKLYLLTVITSKDNADKQIQIKLITKELKIDFLNQQFQEESNANFCVLNELASEGHKIKSYIFQNYHQLLVIYSLQDYNYYHYDVQNEEKAYQYFCGQLQGIGIQKNEKQKSLKVCLKGKIYVIKDIENEQPEKLITHFKERCNNEIIFNLLKEGFKQYCENPKSQNAQYLKLEFQAFSDNLICQVIYQIVWDFMEAPVNKYEQISLQLLENRKKLVQWKEYTKTIVKNQSIILNLIRSEICLEVGYYISQNESDLKVMINACLNEWLFCSQYELQFYSKLEDIHQIVNQLIQIEGQEQHLLNILTLIYQSMNELKQQNQIKYPKFWTNDEDWLQILQYAISKLKNKQSIDLTNLFNFVISDCATILSLEPITPNYFSVVYQFAEIVKLDQFQTKLIENKLYELLYQCYLKSNLQLDVIFGLIQSDQLQCQLFINMCIEHENNNPYPHENYKKLHQILDKIEEKNCVSQVLRCLEHYPKLKNIMLIRTMQPELIQQTNNSVKGDENALYYKFLMDTSNKIVQKNNSSEIEIE